MISFTIEGDLPDLNSMIAAAKKHYGSYSALKKKATTKVKLSCLTIPKLHINHFFKITYFCKDKRKDTDNISVAKKFLFDGLIAAGKLENDGWSQIKGWEEHFVVDKQNPRIEVEVF